MLEISSDIFNKGGNSSFESGQLLRLDFHSSCKRTGECNRKNSHVHSIRSMSDIFFSGSRAAPGERLLTLL